LIQIKGNRAAIPLAGHYGRTMSHSPETVPHAPDATRCVLPDGVTRPAAQGRLAHADRTRRYRARGKKVTHHGSPELPRDDLLAPGSPTIAGDAATPEERPRRAASHCRWCGRRCAVYNGTLGSGLGHRFQPHAIQNERSANAV
jgi:hypothetical protein